MGELLSPQFIQSLLIGIFGGGLVSGIFALLSKKARSPESQNELARLGNEFAAKLLEDARLERQELRETIRELEQSIFTKDETIQRLKTLLEQKDHQIRDLEQRRYVVAHKLQTGEKITLADIFGDDAPSNIQIIVVDDPTPA